MYLCMLSHVALHHLAGSMGFVIASAQHKLHHLHHCSWLRAGHQGLTSRAHWLVGGLVCSVMSSLRSQQAISNKNAVGSIAHASSYKSRLSSAAFSSTLAIVGCSLLLLGRQPTRSSRFKSYELFQNNLSRMSLSSHFKGSCPSSGSIAMLFEVILNQEC